MEKLSTVELAKKLISTPSYVDSNSCEKNLLTYLYEYLKTNTSFTITKQKVEKNRFNLILSDNYPTTLLITAHVDTVQPKDEKQLTPRVVGDKLYGLGSSDMKGSLAALVKALEGVQNTEGVMVLLYVDEEYDFLGMKQFISEYKNKIQPKIITSCDCYDGKLGNACRGLVELKCIVLGKTGHASNPGSGVNAIQKSIKAIKRLSNRIELGYQSKLLGKTTCNLAYLQGGLCLGRTNNRITFGKEGNNIPDIAEFILDIRTTSTELNAKKISTLLKQFLQKEKLQLIEVLVRHDYGAWITKRQDLEKIQKTTNTQNFSDSAYFGYIDIQMLWEVFGKVPCFTLGAGIQNTAHKKDEYVTISSIKQSEIKYVSLIQNLKGGEEL